MLRIHNMLGPVLEGFLEEEAFDMDLRRPVRNRHKLRFKRYRGNSMKKMYYLVYGI